MLDSTIPHFYLPQTICEAFESAFGLTWDNTTQLYTLNKTQHATLTKLNPTVTFTLSPQTASTTAAQSVAISLPYSAFDLTLSWPYANSSTAYFPLKRAANETQYTLGRAFFQEAYVIADYERQNFSVWPCKWDSDTNNAKVLPILSKSAATNGTGNTGSSGSSDNSAPKKSIATGAIAGIAVGAVLVTISVGIAVWWFCFKKQRDPKKTTLELEAQDRPVELEPDRLPSFFPSKRDHAELDSRQRHELADHETKFGILEAPGERPKFEMEDTGTPSELDAGGKAGLRPAVYEMDASQVSGKLDAWVSSGDRTPPSVRSEERMGIYSPIQGNGRN